MLLTATIAKDAAACSVAACGEVDLGSASVLQERVEEALSGPCRQLKLDLRRVEFIDSAGVRVLLWAADRCSALDIQFSVAASPAVARVLELVGFPPESAGNWAQ